MEDKINDAIRLLERSGYIVIRETRNMEMDMFECAEMGQQGRQKDCLGCSCNICIMTKEGM